MTTKPNSDVGDFLQGLFGSAEIAPAQVSTGTAAAAFTQSSEADLSGIAGGASVTEQTSSTSQRDRREREALAVGDVVLEGAVGPGKITSFTSRGVPRVNEVPAAWLKRADGFVYDPMGRRRS